MKQAEPSLDPERLLRLRLVVARFGEMDIAKWWNTKGQLGRLGGAALRRGFPRTHHFAQARSVFAVAGHRCQEVFEPPECVTLWRLTEVIEDEFDAHWEYFFDHAGDWEPFFQKLQGVSGTDLIETLRSFGLVTDRDVMLQKVLEQLRSNGCVIPDLARAEPRALPVGNPQGQCP